MNAGIGESKDSIFTPLEGKNLQFVFHTNIAWGFNTLLAPLGESKILQVNLDGVIKGE
jgi:hypothetical protein